MIAAGLRECNESHEIFCTRVDARLKIEWFCINQSLAAKRPKDAPGYELNLSRQEGHFDEKCTSCGLQFEILSGASFLG